MARYIDADELIRLIEIDALCYKPYSKRDAIACVKTMPTADVAPRAEVDELIYKLECLLCHATGGKLSKYTYDLKTMETVVTDYFNESYSEGVEDGYKDGAAEVAREIFEEIERFNRPPLPECEPVYIIKASELSGLKKKYTEAETEPPKESKR